MKKNILEVTKYIIPTFMVLLNLFPFVWVINSSLRDNTDIFNNTLGLARNIMLDNYRKALKIGNFSIYLRNSFLVVAFTIVLAVLVASMSAYVSAKIWKSSILYSFLSIGIMVPVQVLLVPEKILLKSLGLTNSLFGVILVYAAINLSMSFFIMHPFMAGIPKELEEAAWIDGCGNTKMFFSIVLPMVKPGLATAVIMISYTAWNEYLVPLCLITSDNLKLVSQGLNELKGLYGLDYGMMCAGVVMVIFPVVIMYIFFQRYLIAGASAGAIKG